MDDSADEVSELSVDYRETHHGGDTYDQLAAEAQGRRGKEKGSTRMSEDNEGHHV